jgi:hypothetical protein
MERDLRHGFAFRRVSSIRRSAATEQAMSEQQDEATTALGGCLSGAIRYRVSHPICKLRIDPSLENHAQGRPVPPPAAAA